jgi:hypothetical protein
VSAAKAPVRASLRHLGVLIRTRVADLRLVRYTHVRYFGISYAQLPAGTITHHWYEDRGCRQSS